MEPVPHPHNGVAPVQGLRMPWLVDWILTDVLRKWAPSPDYTLQEKSRGLGEDHSRDQYAIINVPSQYPATRRMEVRQFSHI